jgi:hypothetical protein
MFKGVSKGAGKYLHRSKTECSNTGRRKVRRWAYAVERAKGLAELIRAGNTGTAADGECCQ